MDFMPVSSCDDGLGVSPDFECIEKPPKSMFGFFNGACVQYLQDSCEPTKNSFLTRDQCLKSKYMLVGRVPWSLGSTD